MADPEKRRRLIPPKTSRQRTIVFVVLIAVVAIILIVVALALTTHGSPSQGSKSTPSGGGVYPQNTQTSNLTSKDIKVATYTIDQNATTGETTFLVTVTNTGSTSVTRDLNVAVGQTSGVTAPNQPYASRQTPTSNAVLTNSTAVTIAPGETKNVAVSINTPPGFAVEPGNVVITFT